MAESNDSTTPAPCCATASSTAAAPCCTTAPAKTAAPKLRDSCHGCATSKLKCSKDKPTCTRCAKRGIVCEYFATRRGGRRQETRSKTVNLPKNHHLRAASAWPDSTTPSSGGGPAKELAGGLTTASLSGPDLAIQQEQMRHRQEQHGGSAAGDAMLTTGRQPWSTENTLPSTPSALDAQFDGLFPSPVSFSMLDSASSYHGHQNSLNELLRTPSLMALAPPLDNACDILEDTVQELAPLSDVPSLPDTGSSIPSDLQFFSDFLTKSSLGCLSKVLELLQNLFPSPHATCTAARTYGPMDDLSRQPRTFQSVITTNASTIETITNILQCPCSHDTYMLATISLTLFKVLGWYAAAVINPVVPEPPADSTGPHSCSQQVLLSPTVIGSYTVGGVDQHRMAAQLVLSELHRVQRLVNILSQRLLVAETSIGVTVSDVSCHASLDGVNSSSPPPASLFPKTVLSQLETDIRKRLRELSTEIVQLLQRA